jgi:hypothetical protein
MNSTINLTRVAPPDAVTESECRKHERAVGLASLMMLKDLLSLLDPDTSAVRAAPEQKGRRPSYAIVASRRLEVGVMNPSWQHNSCHSATPANPA